MLKAVHQIHGVKSVTAGRGKGGTIAYPGDLFEPVSDQSGENLVLDGAAELANKASVAGEPRRPEVSVDTGASQASDRMPGSSVYDPVVEEPTPAPTKSTKGKAKAKAAQAAEPEEDDLGLGDGSVDE